MEETDKETTALSIMGWCYERGIQKVLCGHREGPLKSVGSQRRRTRMKQQEEFSGEAVLERS